MTIPSTSEFVISVGKSSGYGPGPRAATLADGRVVVAWRDPNSASGDIRHKIIDVDGTLLSGDILSTASSAGDQSEPAIAALDGGGFVIVWRDWSGPDQDVRYRVFDAAGTPVATGLVTAGETTTGIQNNPAVAGTADGGFVVIWSDSNASNTGLVEGRVGLVGRAFDASGVAQGGIVRISGAEGAGINGSLAIGEEQAVFVRDDDLLDGIYLTQTGTGLPEVDTEEDGFAVTEGSEAPSKPDVAITSAGTVVVWQEDNRVYYRIGEGDVANLTDAEQNQSSARIKALPTGGFVVTWD
jgi:hypothetical protein